ncbi:amidohydrolase [Syntrophobotulus glycolicus DSM 8271]|uniref:Amidohydrolase n=1 Tax=Syntrophobotulus glycolicus (strain DSM 8271 / FlGlyR) TaxID=645991 RepID=F0T2F1_SYNGF|nr:M20 family metallopeptidase [Syntrophobotulus glycolicus]ADY55269.1 amidohydrolase [Syntrophobotulus glycolicus DSM 8271]
MNISPAVSREMNYLVSIRRHLHKYPELSLKEQMTSAYVGEQLESMGISYRRVGETGILGIIEGGLGQGKTVLLRADMDALPIVEETGAAYSSQNHGVMHACGHDLHTASLIGAAKILQAGREAFAGKVLLVFQPAEEFGHGSKFFLQENITAGVDRAFGLHASPDFPVGSIAVTRGADAASCDYFKITVHGRDAHISKPKRGIDALYIACLIVTKLKTLVRQVVVDPQETALIGVGRISSGTTYNIIAGNAVIEGTVRTFQHETQDLLKQEIINLAEQTARSNGGRAVPEFETFTAPLINDDTAFEEICAVAEKILGAGSISTEKSNIIGFGSDDFAEYLRDTKGVYVHIGTANTTDPNTKASLHSSKFDIDEKALLVATELFCSYALFILQGR